MASATRRAPGAIEGNIERSYLDRRGSLQKQGIVLVSFNISIETAFALVDCPIGHDVFARVTFNVVSTALTVDVFAQLSEVHRFPANRIGVDEARKMVVEPSDDTVEL